MDGAPGSSRYNPVLTHADFRKWWEGLPAIDRLFFNETYGGDEFKARYVCALDLLNLAGKVKPGFRGTEAQAYASAFDCSLQEAQKRFEALNNDPAVFYLRSVIRQLDMAVDSPSYIPPRRGMPRKNKPKITPVDNPLIEKPAEPKRAFGGRGKSNEPQKPKHFRTPTRYDTPEEVDNPEDYVWFRFAVDKSDWNERALHYSRDLYTLCHDLMGYPDMHAQPHDEMTAQVEPVLIHLKDLEDSDRYRILMLVPRDCFKTSIGTQGLCLYLLIHFPNLAILIDTHTHGYSKEILADIKWHIESNPKFKAAFGDWVTGSTKWDESSIKINRRTLSRKEGSIDTAGVDKARTGGHYDVIICDDLHNEKNAFTESGRKKVVTHISTLQPILQPYGALVIIGTRWHHADAYGKIIKEDARLAKEGKPEDYHKLIRGAYLPGRDPFTNKPNLYFPTRLTHEKLAELERGMTEEQFANWYLNEPSADRERVFRPEYIQTHNGVYLADTIPVIALDDFRRRLPVYVTIAWDPAGRKSNPHSAFHGLSVVGQTQLGDRYVLDAAEMKAPASEILDYVIGLILTYQPRRISIEDKGGYGAQWIEKLKEAMDARGISVPIHEYNPSNGQGKIERIKAMQIPFKQRKYWIRHDLDRLIAQLEEFPQLDFFDIIDTLPQHEEISRPADPQELSPFVRGEEDFDAPEKSRSAKRGGWWTGRSSQTPGRRAS